MERLLVPLSVLNVRGAFGTRWSTELVYRNHSSTAVGIFPVAVGDWRPAVNATERLPIFYSAVEAPGQFLYATRPGVDALQFDLRLFDAAHPENGWGTRLPVVREHEFGERVTLINVPSASDYRLALRVYGASASTDAAEIEVRLYDDADRRLLASASLPLQRPHAVQELTPLYAQVLSLHDLFPELSRARMPRVEVTSRRSDVAIWGFISVTSNATQFVTILTP